jgi:hypothetical protein
MMNLISDIITFDRNGECKIHLFVQSEGIKEVGSEEPHLVGCPFISIPTHRLYLM